MALAFVASVLEGHDFPRNDLFWSDADGMAARAGLKLCGSQAFHVGRQSARSGYPIQSSPLPIRTFGCKVPYAESVTSNLRPHTRRPLPRLPEATCVPSRTARQKPTCSAHGGVPTISAMVRPNTPPHFVRSCPGWLTAGNHPHSPSIKPPFSPCWHESVSPNACSLRARIQLRRAALIASLL